LAALISGIGHLRKRLWRNAFLSVAAVALALSVCLARTNAAFAPGGTFGMFVFLAILTGIPNNTSLSRSRFLAVSSMVGALVAANTGLLGSGPVARIVGDFGLVAIFIWFLFDLRQSWGNSNSSHPQAPLTSTGT
jgi:hypothetical protein